MNTDIILMCSFSWLGNW